MIAAALLGKAVEYSTSSYHKVPSIADYALKSFPVRQQPSRSERNEADESQEEPPRFSTTNRTTSLAPATIKRDLGVT
jgi:hypothetical protein